MRISTVATRSGMPPSTLRYYERVGLIESRRGPNGYRVYGDDVFERLGFIEAAKQLDLSLLEISELLVVVDGDTCTQVRDVLRPRLTERLREVDAHLARMQLLRDRLVAASRRVAACPDSGESCRSECMLLGERRRTSCGAPGPGGDVDVSRGARDVAGGAGPRAGSTPPSTAPVT